MGGAGEFEGSSLVRAVNNKLKTQHGRPMTYDFMKSSLDELGVKVRARRKNMGEGVGFRMKWQQGRA